MSKEVIEKPVEEQTAEELAASIALSQSAVVAEEKPAETPAEPVRETPKPEASTEHTYTAGDGTVYKAGTSEELFRKVTDALNTTKTALKDREFQIHDLKKVAPPKEAATVTEKFEQQKYLDLVATDGAAALEYQKKYDSDFKAIREQREAEAAQRAVADEVTKFYRDVPAYASVETPEVNAIMKERMEAKGRGFTADALIATYYELKFEGKIGEPSTTKPVEKKTPMPSSASGTTPTTEPEPDFDSMDTKALTAYMKKNGVPGAEYLQ